MKRKNTLTPALLTAGAMFLSNSGQAVNLTSLSSGTALYNGGVTNSTTATTPIATQTLTAGHTFNIAFTPGAADLSGTVLLGELGGTANGWGLFLLNGQLIYSTKHNSLDQNVPSGIPDLSLRPNGSSSGEAVVMSSFGGLTAGLSYSAAVSWDQAGNLQLALQEGTTTGTRDVFTLTGVFGNWQGDRSFSVGQNPRLTGGGVGGSVGGMGGEVSTIASPWDVEEGGVANLKSFSGNIENALYWNAAGNLTVAPEPSAFALMGLAVLGMFWNRRKL